MLHILKVSFEECESNSNRVKLLNRVELLNQHCQSAESKPVSTGDKLNKYQLRPTDLTSRTKLDAKCDQQVTIVSRRHFKSPEFETKLQREVPLLLRIS